MFNDFCSLKKLSTAGFYKSTCVQTLIINISLLKHFMSRVYTSITRQNNLTIFSFEHGDINGLSVDWKNGQEWITKGGVNR